MLLGSLTVVGTVGYIYIDDYPPLDALYMTVITLGTVGFGEIHPLSDAGRIFTIFLIVSSLGLVAYYITLVTRLLLDGEWRKQYRMYLQAKKQNDMKNHVIVCGYGRNGRRACEVLKQNNIPFIIIEQRTSHVNEVDREKELIIAGDATKDEVLMEAGVQRAKALITALPNDSDNLFVVLTARQMNPQMTIISRASDNHTINKLKIAGASNVIMPDKLGGAHMASLVIIPDVHEFFSMLTTQFNDDFKVEEISVQTAANLGELNLWKKSGCTVLGVKQADNHYVKNPGPDYLLMKGESLIVMGNKQQLEMAKTLLA
ncbi:MAG: potassium channel protein [Bacteroidetes bacterium]|nr:MAG: potassium channel protein [Bacteroidota bacterium]